MHPDKAPRDEVSQREATRKFQEVKRALDLVMAVGGTTSTSSMTTKDSSGGPGATSTGPPNSTSATSGAGPSAPPYATPRGPPNSATTSSVHAGFSTSFESSSASAGGGGHSLNNPDR